MDGISIGSEDLYRNSPQGIAAGSYVGAEPATIVDYISQVRSTIAGTALSGAQLGHVDTWTAWVNSSNNVVASACDWIGVDAYPYFQNTMVNDIGVGASLFDSALSQTQSAVGGKPVWVTETGWPVSGKTEGQAEATLDNAKSYWDSVGCEKLFGNVNTWWYTLQDAAPSTPNPSFGVVGSTLSTTPLYDLSCSNTTSSSSSSSASQAASTASSAAGSSTAAAASGSQATSSVAADATQGAGSPGAAGVQSQSSQISLEASATQSATGAGSSAAASASATAGSGSGSGSGSDSSSGTGSGSGSSSGSGSGSGSAGSSGGVGSGSTGSNTTGTASSPTSTVPVSAGVGRLESFGAAFLAIMVAIAAL